MGGARLARGPVWETRRDTAALPEEGEPSGETLLKATHRPPGTQEADVTEHQDLTPEGSVWAQGTQDLTPESDPVLPASAPRGGGGRVWDV